MSYFSSVEIYAKEYFHSLNPIAQRISTDVAATRDAYEDLWITLSYKDQRQVLDETIIHPEAVLKYSFYPQNEPGVEYFPRLRLQTGDKYVVDDEGGKGNGFTWRDEHSAPFSFMTRSQLNLSLSPGGGDGVEPPPTPSKPRPTPKKTMAPPPPAPGVGFIDPPSIVLGGSTSRLANTLSSKLKFPPKSPDEGSLLTKLKNKTAVLKIQSIKSRGTAAEREALVPPPAAPVPKVCKAVVSKPRTPPPPPPKPKTEPPPPPPPRSDPEKKALLEESPMDPPTGRDCFAAVDEANQSLESLQEFHSALNSPVDEVPKTGFDFLDNW